MRVNPNLTLTLALTLTLTLTRRLSSMSNIASLDAAGIPLALTPGQQQQQQQVERQDEP